MGRRRIHPRPGELPDYVTSMLGVTSDARIEKLSGINNGVIRQARVLRGIPAARRQPLKACQAIVDKCQLKKRGRPPRRYERTQEEWISFIEDKNPQLLDWYDEGKTLAEIGKRVGLTRERVRQLVAHSGRASRTEQNEPNKNLAAELVRQGSTNKHIRARTGFAIATISQLRDEVGVPAPTRLTAIQRKIDSARHLLGVESDYKIAKRLGVRPHNVTHYRKILGIPPMSGANSRSRIDRARLESMFHEGKSDDEIALALDCAATSVSMIRSRLGLKRSTRVIKKSDEARFKAMIEAGKSDSEIANAFDCSINTVSLFRFRLDLPRRGYPRSHSMIDDTRLTTMFNDGMSDYEIAKEFGCASQTVACARYGLGLYRRKGHRSKVNEAQIEAMFNEGHSDKEIAIAVDRAPTTVTGIRLKLGLYKNAGPPPQKVDEVRLEAMFHEGSSDSEIATAFSCCITTVRKTRSRLELFRKCGSSKGSKIGKSAYELRRRGLKWSEVDRRLNRDNTCSIARLYALNHELPWPLPRKCNES